jgi:arylsulfatase
MLASMRVGWLVLSLACTSCTGDVPGASAPGGVLLIAIDSLRADHLSCYGYDRDTTPALDALAAQGVRFENAFTAAPAILQSNVALLSGCDPRIALRVLPPEVEGATLTYWSLPRAAPHLAQELLSQGFATAAFVDHPQLGPALGLARGFEEFQGRGREEVNSNERIAPEALAERFARWIDERGESERWFAYVHFGGLEGFGWDRASQWEQRFAPRTRDEGVLPVGDGDHVFHALPRSRWSGGTRTLAELEASYDGGVARIDAALAACVEGLRKSGRLGDTTIVVCGTRGLSLGESGLIGDTGTLSDVDLRVPLVVRPAAGRRFQPGLASAAVASLIDVAPTICSLSGLAIPAPMQGVSLVSALSDAAARPREVAFAGSAFFEGWCALGETYCYEESRPWRAQSELLARTWYGGMLPAEPTLRQVLHVRSDDSSQGHARSAPLDDERVRDAKARFELWNAQVEARRAQLHPNDWDFAREK